MLMHYTYICILENDQPYSYVACCYIPLDIKILSLSPHCLHALHVICSNSLSTLIIESQTLMRKYAVGQLKETCHGMPNVEVKPAHSCVSQRDIQVCCSDCLLPPHLL